MNSHALRRFEPFLATPELPSLGPSSRASRMPLGELGRKLDDAFKETNLSPAKRMLIRSLILLWHDHLDESHSISQEIHNADGSALHGIMHRREPDYSNAKYWFHRVGNHPAFPIIATRNAQFLKSNGQNALAKELLPGGHWDADAFVDACDRATRAHSPIIPTLQAIQEIEFRALLERFCGGEP